MCPSNGFSSYAAYMHEYSIIKHEQHASALLLQPYPLLSTQWVQWQRNSFHPLRALWYMWNFSNWDKTITDFSCLLLRILLLINQSSETEAKLQLSLWETWYIICLKKIVFEFITPCVLSGIFCWNMGCNAWPLLLKGCCIPKAASASSCQSLAYTKYKCHVC